jgi:fructokinase
VIVVAGEALIDLVADTDGRYRPIPGGSPANVAVGLTRLGGRTELLARLGTGVFGRIVRGHLEDNGVGLTHAVSTDDPTTLAVVALDDEGRAAYDFYVEGTADWGWTDDELPDPLPGGTVAVCTGSLAVAIEPGASAIAALLRREHERGAVTLVLDPNVRPALLGSPEQARSLLERLVGLCDVVKVSDEDLAWLLPGEDVASVAAAWAGLGPSLVVVTRGGDGALAATRGGAVAAVPAPPVRVVDTVGAGDAFTAGLVDTLRLRDLLGPGTSQRLAALTTADLGEVLTRAALVAALTCGRAGADPPTAAEVEAAS